MIDDEGSFLGIIGDLDVTIGSDFRSGGTYEIEDIDGEPYIVKYGQLRTINVYFWGRKNQKYYEFRKGCNRKNKIKFALLNR